MATRSAPLRLRRADAPAGEKAPVAFQISSKVNVPVDPEVPCGGRGLVPASSKAAAAGHTGLVKGRAKGRSTTGAAKKMAEPEKPSDAVVEDGCIEKPSPAEADCIEKPSVAVVKSGCIDYIEKPSPAVAKSDRIEKPSGEKPSAAVVKSGCIDCIEKPSGPVVKAGCIDCINKPSGGDVAVLIPVREGLWEMPEEEVQWVLSRRREDIPSDLFGPDCVETINAVRDEFFDYQAWMQAEYIANDRHVFVDDKFVAEREEHQQWMSSWSERVECLGWGDNDFSDRLSDFYEDSEEDEVEVQEELNTN